MRNNTPKHGHRLAELLRRRGRRVTEAGGVYWANVDIGSRYYMSLPDQVNQDVPREAVKELLAKTGGVVCRYPSLAQPGLPCGVYVCTDREYGMPKLQKRMRNFVRRGLSACEMRPVEKRELLEQGLELNLDTMKRHHRFRPEFGDPAGWKRAVDAVYSVEGSNCWGAFIGGRLASYVMTCLDDNWLHLLIQHSRSADLDKFANHALDYHLITQAMADPAVEGVCMGPMALRESEGLHQYKVRLGYQVIRQNAVIRMHPALSPFAKSDLAYALTRWARQIPRLAPGLERVEILMAGARVSSGKPIASNEPIPSIESEEAEASL